VTSFPVPSPWTHISRELKRRNRRAVVAVVAYIGRDSTSLISLRSGDALICDASRPAIRAGLTCARTLRTLQSRGVVIFSITGLHAKVIASPTAAWVGSANASRNSLINLIEASVRVTGAQARSVYRWAKSLTTEDRQLSRSDIRELCHIDVPEAPVVSRASDTKRIMLPTLLDRIAIISSMERSKAENSRVSSTRKRFAQPSSMMDFLWIGPRPPKIDSWFLIVPERGRISRPARVIAASKIGRDTVLWFRYAENGRAPSRQELSDLAPNTAKDFAEILVRDSKTLKALLNLIRA